MAKKMPTEIPCDVKLMNMAASAMLLLAVVSVVVVTGLWAARHSLFAIGAVSVRGDTTHNNEVTLRANTLPKLRGNFFTTDLAQAREAFESAPWVRKALVQREFPNRLRVHLQEHQVAAYWGVESETRLVNVQGEVFEASPGDVDDDALPRLIGPEGQSAVVLAMYRALTAPLEPLGMRIDKLELSARGGWHAQLDNDARLELGRGDVQEVGLRARRLGETLTQVLAKYGRDLESVDLRYSQGYTVRLRGVTTDTIIQDTKSK
jgi:cell division protein FtsQ